jgi:probable phosphoglycerate mutase
MRLILIRHAQSTANVALVMDSLPPGPPLSERGETQARDVAQALAGLPVEAVYASTAQRAQATAAAIAGAHGLETVIVDGVQEVFLGDLEGRGDAAALGTFAEVWECWAAGDENRPVPGGESAVDVLDRFGTAIAGIQRDHPDGVTVVLVSHGAAARLVASHLAGNVTLEEGRRAPLPNTGRIVLRGEGTRSGGWACEEWAGLIEPGSTSVDC